MAAASLALPACTASTRHVVPLTARLPDGSPVLVRLRDPETGAIRDQPARAASVPGITWVDPEGRPIADRDIVSIQVKTVDRQRGALQGVVGGLAAGAVIGAVIGASKGDDPPCDSDGWDCFLYVQLSSGDKAAIGAVGLGLIGAALGGAIGAVVGQTSVDTYGAPGAPGGVPTIAVTPTADGASASARWQF